MQTKKWQLMATHTFSSVYWSPGFPPESLPERQFSCLQSVLINLPYLNKMQNGKLQKRKASKLHQSNILGDLSKMLFAAPPLMSSCFWGVAFYQSKAHKFVCPQGHLEHLWKGASFLPSMYQLLFARASTSFRTLISWPGALTLLISALFKLFVFQRSW